MKKIISILTMVMLFGVCSAQTSSEKKNVFETHFGMSHYVNYPALSVLADNTPSYTVPVYGVMYGRRMDNFVLGAQLDMGTFSTSFVEGNETVIGNSLSLLARHNKNVCRNLDLYAGLLARMDLFVNAYEHMDENYANVRLGIGMEFSVGVSYMLTAYTYVGAHAGLNLFGVSLLQGGNDVPSTLPESQKKSYDGYNLSINYGIRF